MQHRGILYSPLTGKAEEVEFVSDGINELLKCQWITCVDLGGGVYMWLDDEGLLVRPNPHGYFQIPGHGQPYAGLALFSCIGKDGEIASLKNSVTVEAVESVCRPYMPTDEEIDAACVVTVTSFSS